MKTAQEWVKEFFPKINSDDKAMIQTMMQNYAYLVGKQTLKDAAVKATLLYESDSTGKISHYGCTYGTEKGDVRVDIDSILSTTIKTP